jgi:hypothetical protein
MCLSRKTVSLLNHGYLFRRQILLSLLSELTEIFYSDLCQGLAVPPALSLTFSII